MEGFAFQISGDDGDVGDHAIKAARRKFAAPQTVIVSDRRGPRQARFSLAGVRLPGVERSKSAKPT
jgi:hypothetical protein